MNTGRTVFAQLMDLLPLAEFRRSVDRYEGDYKVQSFFCHDQFLCLAFAQLTYRDSLRDIETCLRAHQPKLYHMGIRGRISRNTLAHANERRAWRIYADFARALIAQSDESKGSILPLRLRKALRQPAREPRTRRGKFALHLLKRPLTRPAPAG